jgi:hypothetical protein
MLYLGVMAGRACLTVSQELELDAAPLGSCCDAPECPFCTHACANNGVGWLLNLRAAGQLRVGGVQHARCSLAPVL